MTHGAPPDDPIPGRRYYHPEATLGIGFVERGP